MLIKLGCDVNTKTSAVQQTVLHLAASRGLLEYARVVLENGAHINNRDRDGATPFMTAATYGKLPLVNYLAQSGADINVPTNRGLTPLSVAVQNGNGAVVQELLKLGSDTDICDVQGNNALIHSVVGGQSDITQMLINAGTNVNQQNYANEAAINLSAMYGNTTMTNILINGGCDVNIVSNKGTPVYLAVERQQLNVLKLLINTGADCAKSSITNQKLPITEALRQYTPNYDVIMALLQAGVDIDDAACDFHTINNLLSGPDISVFTLLLQVDITLDVSEDKLDFIQQHYPDIYGMLQTVMDRKVSSLKSLCRKAVKRCIGAVHYKPKIQMVLPKSLQDYCLHYDIIPHNQMDQSLADQFQDSMDLEQ